MLCKLMARNEAMIASAPNCADYSVDERLRTWHEVALHEATHVVASIVVDKPVGLATVFEDVTGHVRGAFFHAIPDILHDERRLPAFDEDQKFYESVKALQNVGGRSFDPPVALIDDLVVKLAPIAIFLPFNRQLAFQYGSRDIRQAAALAKAIMGLGNLADELLNSTLRRGAEICDRNRAAILELGTRLAHSGRMDSSEIKATLTNAGFPGDVSGPADANDPRRWPALFAAVRLRLRAA